MKTTMDAAGRLVIPKEIRRLAVWPPGAPLDVGWHGGRIEIEPAPTPVTLRRVGRFVVAVPQETEGPPLTAAQVEKTRQAILPSSRHRTRYRLKRRT